MEKEVKGGLGGFEAIIDSFIPKSEDVINMDEDTDNNEPITDEELETIKKGSKKQDTEEVEEPEEVEDKDVEEPVKEPKTTKKSKEEVTELVDEPEVEDTNESSVVSSFFDAMSEKLGWLFDEDEEKPKDVDSLIKYFQDVIEESSKPEFASEEIEALDNYVKQGGDLRKYLSIDAEVDLEDLDMDDENNQKIVVRQLLKEKGFSDKQITKKLSKYEEAGLLEDEAQDAIEDLKEINTEKKELLLKEQKKQQEAYIERQHLFYNGVVNEIKGLDNIRGIVVPEKDKKVLIDYILKPDTDGKTKYQKDYAKSGVKGLIESAYFTMNADKLLEAAKKAGSNSAIDRFKKSLKSTSVRTSSKPQINRTDDSIWSSMTRQLRIS